MSASNKLIFSHQLPLKLAAPLGIIHVQFVSLGG